MIQQPAGSRDDNVRPRGQFIGLPAIADTAVDNGDLKVSKTGVVVHGRIHLGGQFAGGFQDQGARAGGLMLAQFGKDGQAKRGGFASAGLGAPNDVLAGHDQRDGPLLNGGRFHVPHGPNTL